MKFRKNCIALLLSICSGLAVSKDIPHYGIFVYSNFCISQESGDLYGNRITLRRLTDGDSLIYEYDDGSTKSVVAENLVVNQNSRKITFDIHAEGNLVATISGQLSKDGQKLAVHGLLFDEASTVNLKLVKDLSAAIHQCN